MALSPSLPSFDDTTTPQIPDPTRPVPTPEQIRDAAQAVLDAHQAADTVVIALAGKATFADYLLITSGRSNRHVSAIADHLCVRLKEIGVMGVAVEGLPQADWVLVDGGDVIIHLFRPEVRSFYNLEKMWGVAPLPAALPAGGSFLPSIEPEDLDDRADDPRDATLDDSLLAGHPSRRFSIGR